MDNLAQVVQPPQPHNRFAFRLGNKLPKVLRILYYIVLFLSMIYFIYRFFEWFLKTIQKIGSFAFEPRNYWAGVMAIFIVALGTFITAQFILGLDPIGQVIEWFKYYIIGTRYM